MADQKKYSDFQDFLSWEQFLGAEYLPKSHSILYSVSRYDVQQKRKRMQIFLRDITSGAERQISAGGEGEGSASLSPDQRRIAFLSVVPGQGRQLFVWSFETNQARQLTTMKNGILDPRWSMDGRSILFASVCDAQRPEEEYTSFSQETELVSDVAVVITDFGYKFDGMGFARPEHLHLWKVDAESAITRRLTDGPFDYLHHTWSPDGRHVLCTSSRFHPKKEAIASDLILIDSWGEEEMQRLTSRDWTVSYPNPVRPVYTHDGKHVVMGFLDRRIQDPYWEKYGYPPAFLHKISIDGSEDIQLMEETEDCYDGVAFAYNAHCGSGLDKVKISSDGQSAYFISGFQGQEKLFKVSLDEPGKVESVVGGPLAVNGISDARDGKMLLALSKPDRPEGYYLLEEETGELTLILQSNQKYLEETQLSVPQELWVPTLDGESRIHGWVLPPQNRTEGETYPAILYIHGGPHPFYTYGFTLEFQCLAANGFGVIYCNPRGSSGYGTTHRNLQRSTDGSAYMDCLTFVDAASSKCSWIAPDRIGVTGGSYGGYMTNYIATHAPKFRAFVSQRSVVNDLISYASSDMQGDSSKYKNFEEFMVNQLKVSPVSYAEKIHAPFLILHGMEDYRTPVEGAHQLFVAIKDLHPDLPVKMVLYPHTGHSQPNDPVLLQHYYGQILDWFRTYL